MKYPNLFTPLRLGKLELRNRLVMPPMTTCFARYGFVTDIIMAAGAVPRKPALPGIANANVVTAWHVLRGDMPRGKKVVVIVSGTEPDRKLVERLNKTGMS
jgi:hypothetical protein